jgi:hypothetical protein
VLPSQEITQNTNGGGGGRGKHACHMRRRKQLPAHASNDRPSGSAYRDGQRDRDAIYTCVYSYTYIHTYIHTHIYIYYIYTESEGARERERASARAPEREKENKGATETHLCCAVDEADWSKLLFPLPNPPAAACCSRAILRSLRSQYVVQHRLCIFRCFIFVVVVVCLVVSSVVAEWLQHRLCIFRCSRV